jgi:Exostosin family
VRTSLRLAACAPARPDPADELGLFVTPWLPDWALAEGWERGPALEADRIVVPWTFGTPSASPFAAREGMARFLELLPSFRAAPERHVLLDNTDTDAPYQGLEGAALFKTSANVRHGEVLPLPYVVLDPGPPSPVAGADLDLAFQGSLDTHPIREWMDRWRHSWTMKVEVKATPRPFWLLTREERGEWAQSYARQMRRTRFVLCPRGRGLNSRRFYEALAFGRVPVLITDAARLPLEGRIDWARFTVLVPEGFGRWAPEYVAEFLATHDLDEACREARRTWETWFAPERFRHFVEASLADAGRLHAPEPAWAAP